MRFHDDFYKTLLFYIKNVKRLYYSGLNLLSASSSWYIEEDVLCCDAFDIDTCFTNNPSKGRRRVLHFSDYQKCIDKTIYHVHGERCAIGSLDWGTLPFTFTNEDFLSEEYKDKPEEVSKSFGVFINPNILKIVPVSKKFGTCYAILFNIRIRILFADTNKYLFENPLRNLFIIKKHNKKKRFLGDNQEVYISANCTFLTYYLNTYGNVYTPSGFSYALEFVDNFGSFTHDLEALVQERPVVDRSSVCYFDGIASNYCPYHLDDSFILVSSEAEVNDSFTSDVVFYFDFLHSLFSSSFDSPEYIRGVLENSKKELSAPLVAKSLVDESLVC